MGEGFLIFSLLFGVDQSTLHRGRDVLIWHMMSLDWRFLALSILMDSFSQRYAVPPVRPGQVKTTLSSRQQQPELPSGWTVAGKTVCACVWERETERDKAKCSTPVKLLQFGAPCLKHLTAPEGWKSPATALAVEPGLGICCVCCLKVVWFTCLTLFWQF